jgi:molybdenum cofactor synthesis domain-containing protein
MLSFAEARRIVLSAAEVLESERAPVEEAFGRVLAEDVVCDIDMPPFDRSAMDGYALCGEAEGPLELVGSARAGWPLDRSIGPGECAEIMTGAPIPAGADRVVKVEDTERTEDGRVLVRVWPAKKANICFRAEDIRAGDLVLARGDRLWPQRLGILAMAGREEVHVVRRPRVAILSTGDELVRPSRKPGPGQVRDANRYLLAGLLSAARVPCDVLDGIVDDLAGTIEVLGRAAESHDVVLTTGGVSMGRTDYVRPALRELGAEIFFEKVAVKPGRPLTFARLPGGALFFGLPGNPVSVLTAFEEFALGALRRMQGIAAVTKRDVPAVLAHELLKKRGRTHLLRSVGREEGGELSVEVLPSSGSGDLMSTSKANCLLVLGPEEARLPQGARVVVHWLYSSVGELAFR